MVRGTGLCATGNQPPPATTSHYPPATDHTGGPPACCVVEAQVQRRGPQKVHVARPRAVDARRLLGDAEAASMATGSRAWASPRQTERETEQSARRSCGSDWAAAVPGAGAGAWLPVWHGATAAGQQRGARAGGRDASQPSPLGRQASS
ncbi:unnamed protein product [Diplocarpon coronariae]